MALKRKIDKATYDALADVLKAEYKANGNDYVLDTDDANELKAAKDREVEARRKAEKDLKDAQDALAALEDKTNRDNGDIDALDKSYKTKIADFEKKLADANTALDNERKDRHVTGEAERIAKRFTVPDLVKDKIAKRLSVEMHDGKAVVRVLDKDGKPSALSTADLEKEFVDNPDYKAIVIASKATGSADDKAKRPGGSAPNFPNNNQGEPIPLAKLDTKSLLAHMKATDPGD